MKLLKLFTKIKKVPVFIKTESNGILKNRVALITGGGSGIGFAIAKLFSLEGCRVIIAGRNEEKLRVAVSQIPNSTYVVMDVSDIATIKEKIKTLYENEQVDILVNAAGIHYSEKFLEITEKEFDTIMGTNLKGTFFISQEVALHMIKKGIHGNILMVSSSSAKRPAWGPYHLSKWMVDGMTKGFADKLIGHDIVVNGIAPGQTATSMLDADLSNINNDSVLLGRFLLPEEVASTALFLVSNYGRNVVGDVVYVSGGSGIVDSHR